jgi:mono/diheme cytochrome c family protein
MCRSSIIVLVVVCVLAAASSARAQNPGGSPEARKMKNPVPPTPASITAGAATYKKYCAFCHGIAGKGDGPLAPEGVKPADLTDAIWIRGSSDGEIFAVIMAGAGPKFDMKGQKGQIPDRDVWNIVNYLRTLGPEDAKD